MTAYIKFCGGCNETFPRSAAAERIKREFKDELQFVPHGSQCDIGILIEGCAAACVLKEKLSPCTRLFEICASSDVDAVISDVKGYINSRFQ